MFRTEQGSSSTFPSLSLFKFFFKSLFSCVYVYLCVPVFSTFSVVEFLFCVFCVSVGEVSSNLHLNERIGNLVSSVRNSQRRGTEKRNVGDGSRFLGPGSIRERCPTCYVRVYGNSPSEPKCGTVT